MFTKIERIAEENKMLDELTKELKELGSRHCNQIDYYPMMAKTLIKTGWHSYPKVEPISRQDFIKEWNESNNINLIFNFLVVMGHIIVKDGAQ